MMDAEQVSMFTLVEEYETEQIPPEQRKEGVKAWTIEAFAIFNRQDLLQLALDLHVPVPEIYGEIRRDDTGALRTTGAQRTGCSMCGFGIQLEKRPHRFDRLFERNPKEWEFWMIEMGWGAVLDYIGVGWRPEHQITMEELIQDAGVGSL